MPIYEYECEKCGAIFEVMQRVSEPELQTCGASCVATDRAGDGRVHKRISRVAAHPGGKIEPSIRPASRPDASAGATTDSHHHHDHASGSCEGDRVRKKYGLD